MTTIMKMLVFFLLLTGSVWAQAEPPVPAGQWWEETRHLVEQELALLAEKLSARENLNSQVAAELLHAYLEEHPQFYGAALAFAPKEEEGLVVKSAPYVYRQGTRLVAKDLIASYDYADGSQQWYSEPLQKGKSLWSDPYYDAGGGDVWMITYTIPIYRAHNPHCPFGVVTTDLVIPAQ